MELSELLAKLQPAVGLRISGNFAPQPIIREVRALRPEENAFPDPEKDVIFDFHRPHPNDGKPQGYVVQSCRIATVQWTQLSARTLKLTLQLHSTEPDSPPGIRNANFEGLPKQIKTAIEVARSAGVLKDA